MNYLSFAVIALIIILEDGWIPFVITFVSQNRSPSPGGATAVGIVENLSS